MPELPHISGQEAVDALERMGFQHLRQRGSHVILRRDGAAGSTGCVVPVHRELAIGTLRSILRQAGVTVEEFTSHL